MKKISQPMGYSGWHTTWDDKKIFLRSMHEYTISCMLDSQKLFYLTEKKIFNINGVNYKPDFFIYSDSDYNRLVRIIEVKHQGDKITANEYLSKFKSYFEEFGISYDVIFRFDALNTKYCSEEMRESWKKSSLLYDSSYSVSGELNPMYGVKHKESTKQLISEKAKKRFEDPSYTNNLKEKLQIFYSSDEGILRRKEIGKRVSQRAAIKRKAIPDSICICKNCGKQVITKKPIEFCSGPCKRTWGYNNIPGFGKHADLEARGFKHYWSYVKKITDNYSITPEQLFDSLDDYVKRSKLDGVIPNNKGMSLETLIKFKIIKKEENGKITINYPHR
jgi:hypothetical protein